MGSWAAGQTKRFGGLILVITGVTTFTNVQCWLVLEKACYAINTRRFRSANQSELTSITTVAIFTSSITEFSRGTIGTTGETCGRCDGISWTCIACCCKIADICNFPRWAFITNGRCIEWVKIIDVSTWSTTKDSVFSRGTSCKKCS